MESREGPRINKYLSTAGVASRRAADRIVSDGRVTINGRIAVLGDRVSPGSVVCLDGKTVEIEKDKVVLILNKPRGITCTSDSNDRDNVIDYINYPKRIYSVGRLDKDSQGLLVMTNDGDFADRIMRSRYGHEKEYIVTVDKTVTDDFLNRMMKGVRITEERVTRNCKAEKLDDCVFRIILRQGLNRQIRRMCDVLGYVVVKLVRVRVMNLELNDLKEGMYRDITKNERKELYDILDSSELQSKDDEDGR